MPPEPMMSCHTGGVLGDGGEAAVSTRELPPVGTVVVAGLTLAALLSAAGTVAELGQFTGISISDRIVQFGVLSILSIGFTLAAALGLRAFDGAEGELPSSLRAVLRAAHSVVAALVGAASCYGIFVVTTGIAIGDSHFGLISWTDRMTYVCIETTSLLLAAAVLYVIVTHRRPAPVETARANVTGPRATARPSWSVVAPAAVWVLAAAVILVARVLDALLASAAVTAGQVGLEFQVSGASISDRITTASLRFDQYPIVFLAFTVVAVVALGVRRDTRGALSGVLTAIAAGVGGLAILAAVGVIWHELHAGSGGTSIGLFGWWGRAATMLTALASGVVGLVVCDLVRRREAARAADEPTWSNVLSALQKPVPVVGVCVALAALSSAAFEAIELVSGAAHLARGELLVQFIGYTMTTAGVALSAVILLAVVGRRRGRDDGLATFVDVVSGVIACLAIGASLYVIWYVRFARPTGRFSLLAQTATDRRGIVASAVATAALAVGTLHLIWRMRQADDEPVVDPELGFAVAELQSDG
jgi:hypothetical protein